MVNPHITSFDELHSYITTCKKRTTIFRGVRSHDEHLLIPSVGRREFRDVPTRREKRMIKLYKESALPFLNFMPRNDWEWLAFTA